MNQFCKNHKKEIFLFLLMFVLELAMIFVLSQKNGINIFFRSDGTEYQRLVQNLIDHKAFSVEKAAPFIPTDYRTPIYPFWLAIIFMIFKSFTPAIFIGAAVFALSAPITYLIGRQFFSEKIAFISGLIFALEPWAIFQSGFLAAEQIFIPTFLFSVYLFCRYLKLKNRNYLFLAVFVLGIAVLIRPIALYFIFIFLILAFISESKNSIGESFKILALAILILILSLSPWLIRNKIVLNSWEISSAASNGVLYIESWALNKYLGKITNEHEWEKAAFLLGTRDYESMKRAEKTKILADYAVREISANKLAFFIMHLKSMGIFFIKNSYGNIFLDLKLTGADIQSKIISFLSKKDIMRLITAIKNSPFSSKVLIILSLFWPIVIIFALLGIFYLFKENYKGLFFWFLIFWIIYFPVLTADLLDESRYKLPINAPLFMLAVFGIYKVKDYFFDIIYKNK